MWCEFLHVNVFICSRASPKIFSVKCEPVGGQVVDSNFGVSEERIFHIWRQGKPIMVIYIWHLKTTKKGDFCFSIFGVLQCVLTNTFWIWGRNKEDWKMKIRCDRSFLISSVCHPLACHIAWWKSTVFGARYLFLSLNPRSVTFFVSINYNMSIISKGREKKKETIVFYKWR